MFIECLLCKEIVDVDGELAEGAPCPACGKELSRVGGSVSETTTAEQPREIGKFRLLQRVGAGSFGAVWKALDLELGRTVAVKLLHPSLVAGKAENERFFREARAAAQLRHPGIVTVHEVANLDGMPAIVSEFVDGVTLRELLTVRRLDWREAAGLVAQVANALDYAHSLRIVHRDVKPGNIMVAFAPNEGLGASLEPPDPSAQSGTHASRTGTASGQGPRARLLDFGLALREEGEATLTTEGQVLGTPAYMSPEQASGESHRVDRRTDVYSLGVVLYELLAGEVPFRGSQMVLLRRIIGEEPRRPRDLRQGVPRDLETICLKAMSKARSARYATAGEMAADLRRFLAGDPILARPVGSFEKLWRFCRRNPTVAALTAGIAAMLVLCTAVSLFFALHAVEARQAEEAARHAVEQTLADSYSATGIQAAELDRPSESLTWFAAASQLAGADPVRQRNNSIRFWSWARSLPLPVRAMGGRSRAKSLVIHPGGRYALARRYKEANYDLYDLAAEQPETFPDGAASAVAAAWNRDGSRLATGAADGQVSVYRFPQGERLARLDHPGAISALAFDDSGRRLAVASDRVRVWDFEPGAFITPAYPHPARVEEVVFSQRGDRLATACADEQCRVWPVPGDMAQTSPSFPPVPHVAGRRDWASSLQAPVFLDKDWGLLTRRGENQIAWIDAATGATVRTITQENTVGWFTLSPDRAYLALGSHSVTRLYDAATGQPVSPFIEHGNYIYSSAFHPDGRSLLTACADRTVRSWSVPQGKPLSSPLPHQGEVVAAAFLPRGTGIVTAQMDGLIRAWRHEPLGRRLPTGGVENGDSFVQLSPDGAHAVGAGFNGYRTILAPRVHDLATGQPACPKIDLQGGVVNNAAFAPDGRRIVVLASLPENERQNNPEARLQAQAGLVHFFDWREGTRYLEPVTTPTEPVGAAFSPNGKRLAVVCAGGEVLLLDAATSRLVRQSSHGGKYAHGFLIRDFVRFSPDGSRFVTWGPGNEARVWGADSGQLGYAINSFADPVTQARFSPDGALLAVASRDSTVAVVEAATGRAKAPPLKHSDWVFEVCFSPDGKHLATACRDRMARVWDWQAGKLACPSLAHSDEVCDVCYAREGRYLVTACRDHTIRVWDAARGKPLGPKLPVRGLPFRAVVTADDAHVVVAGIMPHLLVYRLTDLVEPGPTPAGGLRGLAEVVSGQSLHPGGGTAILTTDEWLERWARFRERNPGYPPLAYSP